MEKEYKMSAARAQELQEDLNYLKATRSDEVAEQIKVARGFGDLSENSEYDEAKNEQGKLYSRIAELEEILLHAKIVNESETDSDKISIGCEVTATNLTTRKPLPVYKIVGSHEPDVMNHAVSEDSPFGKALMGRKAGDEIAVEAPKGMIRYRIDSVVITVSEYSAFGKTLVGRKAGDEITVVETPKGMIRYSIDSVEAPKGVIRYRMDYIER